MKPTQTSGKLSAVNKLGSSTLSAPTANTAPDLKTAEAVVAKKRAIGTMRVTER